MNQRYKTKFAKLYRDGESTCSIADRFGVSNSTVYNYLTASVVCIRTKRDAARLAIAKNRLKVRQNEIHSKYNLLTNHKAYVFGVLCGDGWIWYDAKQGCYQIGLSAIDKDFCQEFARCLNSVYGLKPSIKIRAARNPRWQDQQEVKLCSRKACDDLLSYGFFKTKTWRVPHVIKVASLGIQASFIKGFADSEGSVDAKYRKIRITSSNLIGLKQVGLLLQNFGITYGIHRHSYKNVYALEIHNRRSIESFARNIGFVIYRKQARLIDSIKSYKLLTTTHSEVLKLIPEMMRLRKAGMTYENISNRLGLSIGTVWRNMN